MPTGSEDILEALTFRQHELDEFLDGTRDKSLWRAKIFDYVDDIRRRRQQLTYCIPDEAFDDHGASQWLNVSSALTTKVHLRGRLLVVDFFTYCCINCMHVLPHLRRLESNLNIDELAVIGVHSAKFANEKNVDNVQRAILRYGIEHAVLNDPDMRLWKLCQIICWPTLMLVGPNGEILYKFVGEKNIDRLETYVTIFIDYFKGKGEMSNTTAIPLALPRDVWDQGRLCCPGKIAISEKYLAISDSSNHRVLILNKDSADVAYVAGSGGQPGWQDGSLSDSRFNSPQGLCWNRDGAVLFVADTENHVIRKIDLDVGQVSTVIGTGRQGEDYIGGNAGLEQEISSPWDLTLWKGKLLLIAMAGTHQIWAYAIQENEKLFDGKVSVEAGTCICIAGSGREENRNTSYPLRAGFAQPSGLALSSPDAATAILVVADSESSAIRLLDLNSGAVKNICGGGIDPVDLFCFGDCDGKGSDAKLQHPLAVAWNTRDNHIFVADSYNHKLKRVDPKTRLCETVEFGGSAMLLNEPGGLAFDSLTNRLYIADTNNHQVKVIDLDTDGASHVIGPDLKFDSTSGDAVDTADCDGLFVEYEPDQQTMKVGARVRLRINLKLSPTLELNADAPQFWTLKGDGVKQQNLKLGSVAEVSILQEKLVLDLLCSLVVCNKLQNTCEMRELSKQLELVRGEASAEASALQVTFEVKQ